MASIRHLVFSLPAREIIFFSLHLFHFPITSLFSEKLRKLLFVFLIFFMDLEFHHQQNDEFHVNFLHKFFKSGGNFESKLILNGKTFHLFKFINMIRFTVQYVPVI